MSDKSTVYVHGQPVEIDPSNPASWPQDVWLVNENGSRTMSSSDGWIHYEVPCKTARSVVIVSDS
jgi:hypothetical protein